MTSRDFCYWLQGYFEIQGPAASSQYGEGVVEVKPLNWEQVEVIQKHLALVFKHEIDPSMGDAKHQEELNNIHSAPHKPNPNTVLRC